MLFCLQLQVSMPPSKSSWKLKPSKQQRVIHYHTNFIPPRLSAWDLKLRTNSMELDCSICTFTNSFIQSRQQIIEHLRLNRQRTDSQKIEIQQRRNALIRRIKVWRVAQAVYMPQASAHLPDGSAQATPNDAPMLDNSKPETWPLFLPSTIPKDDRSPCYKGVVETEWVLRLAQLQDNLVDLRRFRRTLRNLRLYFKTNMAGEGQKTQTKSRTIETSVNNRIKRAVSRYRTAYSALIELDPTGDWTMDFLELRDEDNRGPLKELGEIGTCQGHSSPSSSGATRHGTVVPH